MLKQRSYAALFLIVALTGLAGCASFGGAPPAPKSIDQSLVYAQSTATAALEMVAPLMTSRAITAAQGNEVVAAADLVRAAVKKARGYVSIGDAAGAQAQLAALAADLQLLSDFLSEHPRGSP